MAWVPKLLETSVTETSVPEQPAEDRQPDRTGDSGQRKSNGQRDTAGPPDRSGPARGPGAQGPDLMSEFQRWLIRSSARNLRREIGGQVRKTFGADREQPADVWGTVTTEPSPGTAGEAPECAWCPVCRAARKIRESGPGLGSQLSGAGDAVAQAVSEALDAFNGVLSHYGPPAPGPRSARPGTGRSGGDATQADTASSEGPEHGPDDRG
jgi:hypothetical protein